MTVPVTAQNVAEVCEKLARGELPPGKCAVAQLAGSVRLWHPAAGVQVTLPVCGGTGSQFDYAAALANVSAALAAGWLAAAPGLEAGEERAEIGYVVKREKENADRTVTPVVDLYPADDGLKFALLSVYLNTADDVAAFERASGLKVGALPTYIGDNKIERGKKRELDKLVTKAPKPFGVVWGQNPKYDEKEAEATKAAGKAYTVSKRKFLRWAGQDKTAAGGQPVAAQPAARAPAPSDEPQTPAWLVNEYRMCVDEEQFQYLESVRTRLWPAATAPGERTAMKAASEECKRRLEEESPVPF